jgi:hypothetical protein
MNDLTKFDLVHIYINLKQKNDEIEKYYRLILHAFF